MKKSTLPYRAGGFSTLAKAMDYAAQSASGVRFYDEQGELFSQASYAQIREQALKLAAYFKTLKIARGSTIGMLAQTRLEFHIVFFACQYAGLVPCPLPFTILPSGREAYEQKLCQLLRVVQANLLVTPQSIEPIAQHVGKTCNVAIATYEKLITHALEHTSLHGDELTPLSENEAAYVQFSSGSTSEPSGLLITQKMVMSNLNVIATDGMQVIENERIFSWLPFDHNMGLVSFVLSVVNTQSHVDYIAPSTFMRSPQLWLELMSKNKSTMTFAPVFAYALALQKRDPKKPLDLSALRVAGIGGDMIHAQTLRDFAAQMQNTGFKFESFCPGYGLTEATMAVTITRPNEPPFIKTFGNANHCQELVSCGKALPGYDIKITNASNSVFAAHAIGEIWVKGPSIVTSSLNTPQKTILDNEGFITTGDLGFLYEQHLFITGRVKDLIIVRGRNIWAQDVEWVVRACESNITENGVAAFGLTQDLQEQLFILIENHLSDEHTRQTLQKNILGAINQTFGVKAQLVWIAPNQLATTSVGKLARAEIKKNYLNKTLKLIDTPL